MTEIKELTCVVCEKVVVVDTAQMFGGQQPLCIDHFFAEDPTQEWEADDGTISR
jgi:hypothetical protein